MVQLYDSHLYLEDTIYQTKKYYITTTPLKFLVFINQANVIEIWKNTIAIFHIKIFRKQIVTYSLIGEYSNAS